MSQSLLLMTRPECELCERAAAVATAAGASWQFQDISLDIELLRRYRVRIPVLLNPVTGEELGWPFGEAEVRSFLGESK